MALKSLMLIISIFFACVSFGHQHNHSTAVMEIKRKDPDALRATPLEYSKDNVVVQMPGFAEVRIAPAMNDVQWHDLVCKGGLLMQKMRSNDAVSTPSGVENYADIEKVGWSLEDNSETGNEMFSAYAVGSYRKMFNSYMDRQYRKLLSEGAEPYEQVLDRLNRSTWIHQDIPDVYSRPYETRSAVFDAAYDVETGTIVAIESKSPRFVFEKAIQNHPPSRGRKFNVANLGQWSDITFLTWQEYAKEKAGNIDRIVRGSSSNDLTSLMAVQRALIERGFPLAYYDTARDFNTLEDDGLALLGTAMGEGVSWFLINHKKQLGCLEVSKIRVFKKDSVNLDMFEVGTDAVGISFAFFIGHCLDYS